MTWIIFTAVTLACFRLTRLITDDKITDWLRSLIVREAPKQLKVRAHQGITCPFCVSFYWAVVLTVCLGFSGLMPWGLTWLWAPAVWGGSVLWNQLFMYWTKGGE